MRRWCVQVGFDTLKEAVGSLVDKCVKEDVEEEVGETIGWLKGSGSIAGHLTLNTLRARNMGRKKQLDITLEFPPTMQLADINQQVWTVPTLSFSPSLFSFHFRATLNDIWTI